MGKRLEAKLESDQETAAVMWMREKLGVGLVREATRGWLLD